MTDNSRRKTLNVRYGEAIVPAELRHVDGPVWDVSGSNAVWLTLTEGVEVALPITDDMPVGNLRASLNRFQSKGGGSYRTKVRGGKLHVRCTDTPDR